MPADGIGALNLPVVVLVSVGAVAVVLLIVAMAVALTGNPIRWLLPPLILSWVMAIAVMGTWWSEVFIEGVGLRGVVTGTACAIVVFVVGTKLITDTVEDQR